MNIAVVTVYDGLNFGSFLQAFAMKVYLEEQGHYVSFVQRFTEEENLALFTTDRPKEDCGKLKKLWRAFRRITVERKKIEKQNRYYREQFPYYQQAWRLLKLIRPDQLENVDCIVCGSDEIWNLNNLNIDVPFYSCAGYADKITKIAIAASVGNSTREDFKNNPQVESAFLDFKEILVRDGQSKAILEDIVGHETEVVCDPTLLVDRKVFCCGGQETTISESYMFVYTYGLTDAQSKILSDYAKKKHYRIVSACMDIDIADQVIYASPLDFAKWIAEAECCVTTTFHGTIFSLLFAKRFCTIAKYPKISDLISNVGAEAHLWDGENSEKFEHMMNMDADRPALDIRLEELRKKSSNTINRVLERIMVKR